MGRRLCGIGDPTVVMMQVLSARFKPRERTIFLLELEMLNLRPNEMTGDARHDIQEPAIGDGGYAFNLSMMIGDEFEM